jgi:TetR/AcrR family transcriptional regulator, transcriptional repressor for nem operon
MTLDTRTSILDTAEALTKQKGLGGFSYRDIAHVVGIKTSSIHYHFPTKEDLAAALVERYVASFTELATSISASRLNGYEQIRTLFAALVELSGRNRNLCLCGMLCAEIPLVPEPVKLTLDQFFTSFEVWLETILGLGVQDGSIQSSINPHAVAKELAATVEGAMLIARSRSEGSYFREVLDNVLARLRG